MMALESSIASPIEVRVHLDTPDSIANRCRKASKKVWAQPGAPPLACCRGVRLDPHAPLPAHFVPPDKGVPYLLCVTNVPAPLCGFRLVWRSTTFPRASTRQTPVKRHVTSMLTMVLAGLSPLLLAPERQCPHAGRLRGR